MKMRMIQVLVPMALLAASLHAHAEGVTTGGDPACHEPHWLEMILAHRDDGDSASYERYLNTGRCIELREGMEITVETYYGDAAEARVEFLFRGYRLFAERSAVAAPL